MMNDSALLQSLAGVILLLLALRALWRGRNSASGRNKLLWFLVLFFAFVLITSSGTRLQAYLKCD